MKMEHTELHGTVIKEIYSTLKRNDLNQSNHSHKKGMRNKNTEQALEG